ncbi:hypothetical protein CspeluHIS016_0503310 [Cutaneotrichosporon spelunceum]|uniref:Glycosyl hydrolase n=1 Tax=Cutaneotrichosporon spelunceum TaxID=1672016 RepID=A0AAD3YDU2_9TREE|nr:hypothetical protein CspeluHIS016_0503310 [Cutaneotrichosporon spelunceum]
MTGTTTLDLTPHRAEDLIRLLTDGLVNIQDKTGEFLLHLEDGTVIDTKGWAGWEWTHGIALTALYHHQAIAPKDAAAYSTRTAMDWFEAQYKISAVGAPKNINTMSPFYALSSLMADDKVADARWSAWCDDWAEWVMHRLPRTRENGFQHMTYNAMHDQQLWDDTLMMSAIPLARIGKLLNRPHYVQEAKYQFLLHAQYLTHTPSGLWYHGWRFTPAGGDNFAGALWARGNCWITIAIPLLLEILHDEMPEGDAVREFLVSTLRRQIDALVRTQSAGGLWHTLLLDDTSYVESSASAGFAAGIYMALRMGLVNGDEYRQCADRALAAVIGCIREDGELEQVSFGTAMGDSFQFYKDIPITSMPYGQALAMLALVEWERIQAYE